MTKRAITITFAVVAAIFTISAQSKADDYIPEGYHFDRTKGYIVKVDSSGNEEQQSPAIGSANETAVPEGVEIEETTEDILVIKPNHAANSMSKSETETETEIDNAAPDGPENVAPVAPVIDQIIEETTVVTTTYSDGTQEVRTLQQGETVSPDGTIVRNDTVQNGNKKKSLKLKPFIFGGELGTSIDLSGMDMSTFNFDIFMGYRNKWIQTVGIGAGYHKSLGFKDSFIPLYILFRSSFRPKPSLCFFHLKLGYSFNTISDSATYGDIACSIGCGFNLIQKRNLQSYILLCYGFRHFTERHLENMPISRANVSMAQITFGVSF